MTNKELNITATVGLVANCSHSLMFSYQRQPNCSQTITNTRTKGIEMEAYAPAPVAEVNIRAADADVAEH